MKRPPSFQPGLVSQVHFWHKPLLPDPVCTVRFVTELTKNKQFLMVALFLVILRSANGKNRQCGKQGSAPWRAFDSIAFPMALFDKILPPTYAHQKSGFAWGLFPIAPAGPAGTPGRVGPPPDL